MYVLFAAVIPVAAATMTPLPLLVFLGMMKFREWRENKKGEVVSQQMDGEVMEDEMNPKDEKKCPIVKTSESSQKLVHCPLKIHSNGHA